MLLVSEDLDEILALADRVAVMYEGRIVGELDARRRRRGDRPADGRGAGTAVGSSGGWSSRGGSRSRCPRLARVRLRADRRSCSWRPAMTPARPTGGSSTRVPRCRGADVDARLREAARVHRAGGGGRLPHAALQHRRRGAAVSRRDRRGAAWRSSLAGHRGVSIAAMIAAGARCGAAWALIPAVLRAFCATNEIITSLMLNYVAALILNYLIFDRLSYWRDTSSPRRRCSRRASRCRRRRRGRRSTSAASVVPFGFLLAIGVATTSGCSTSGRASASR